MSDAFDGTKRVIAVSEVEYMERMKNMLLMYRGRVGIILRNMPTVTILAKVYISFYDVESECVEMRVDVGGGKPPLALLFYPKDIRRYRLYGISDVAHLTAENETGNDCPARVRLLD